MGRDREPELVTAETMEKLGYERPELWRNSRLQRALLDNREQISAVVQPWIERELGVPVELTGVRAPFPWDEAAVGWSTVAEPVFSGTVYVRVGADGSVGSEDAILEQHVTGHELALFPAVAAMAYRPELETIRAYLASTYPGLRGSLPAATGTADGTGHGPVRVSHDTEAAAHADVEAGRQAVWKAFRKEPVRPDEDWRALLERVGAGVPMDIGVTFTMVEPGLDVPEDLVRRIAEDLRGNPLFDRFTRWHVVVESNLHVRDSGHPHHVISVQWVHATGRWVVHEERDGVRVR